MRVILRSASRRQLALFSLVFTYSVSLNFVTICTGPYVSQLFYVASRFLLVFMLLGFILFVLPYNPKGDAIAQVGVTRSLFFQWLVFFGFTCPAVACSQNYCNGGVFHVSLIKCFLGLADRRVHASKCCFVSSVVQWRQNSIVPGVHSNNSGFTCRSQKRFSLFYSSSKALSDDISLTWKLKTAFNPFW